MALVIELPVEHLILKVGSGLRLEEHAGSGGLDNLVVLAGARRCCDLQRTSVLRFWDRGCDPQAGPAGACGIDVTDLTASAAASVRTSMRGHLFTSRPAEGSEGSRRCADRKATAVGALAGLAAGCAAAGVTALAV